MIVGALQGPLDHLAYRIMDKTVPGATIQRCLMKCMMNVCIFSPISITWFITNCCLHCDHQRIQKCNAREKFGSIYLVNFI